MELKDVEKLAELSRIKMTPDEMESIRGEINSILDYVGVIQEVAGGSEEIKEVGLLHNVMREDGEPHESGVFTEELLAESPDRDGQYIRVKKIIEK